MVRSSEEFAERRQGWDQEPEKPRQVDLEEDGKERDKTVNTSWKGGSVAKTLFPKQGTWVRSLVKGTRSHMLQLRSKTLSVCPK